MRAKKAFINMLWGFIYEITVLSCGFILPKLILDSFGSEYNGITSTITQFLQVISLFQAGIGGATMAALYKPLAEGDQNQVSIILKTTEKYLRKVSCIFLGIAVIIALTLPFMIDEFDFFFTFSLVLIMSISTFVQYFFGLTYQFLLNADQCQRLMFMVNTVKVILNTVVSVILIRCGFGIHAVKLGAAVVFAIAPIFVYFYVSKKYKISKNVAPDNKVISQRWDSFAMEAANFFTINTPLIVLAMFTNMNVASIYTAYNLVIAGLIGILAQITNAIPSAFGNMFAKNEQSILNKNLLLYEQLVFTLVTFFFGIASAVIVPFVEIYTSDAKDINAVNYTQYAFAYVFIASTMFRIFKGPYAGITFAAGHFKQNRNLSFVEAGINIVISVICTIKFGLIGVALGSLGSAAFRTIRFGMYVSKNLIPRSNLLFLKRILLSFTIVIITAAMPYVLPLSHPVNYISWIINSSLIAGITLALISLSEFIFYRKDLKELIKMIRAIMPKRKSGQI